MNNSRLVYSTELGRICPSCGRPTKKCTCKKKKPSKKQSTYPKDGIVRIRREVKGRKGKTVTAVFGVPLDDKKLKQFAKILKQKCGTGGSVKDGVIRNMKYHPVSKLVNSVKNNDPNCIKPIEL